MTLRKMDEWSQDGYFDRALYQIFLCDIEKKGIVKMNTPKIHSASGSSLEYEYRKEFYAQYINTWQEILKITKAIEAQYEIGRWGE